MNAEPAVCERNAFLASLAAELTDAAYQLHFDMECATNGTTCNWISGER